MGFVCRSEKGRHDFSAGDIAVVINKTGDKNMVETCSTDMAEISKARTFICEPDGNRHS